MMLTRSFITSYLIINSDRWFIDNSTFISTYIKAANQIQSNSYIEVKEPSDEEKRAQNQKISIVASQKKLSLQEMVYSVLAQYISLSQASKNTILSSVIDMSKQKDGNMTDDEIIKMTQKLAQIYGEIQ